MPVKFWKTTLIISQFTVETIKMFTDYRRTHPGRPTGYGIMLKVNMAYLAIFV